MGTNYNKRVSTHFLILCTLFANRLLIRNKKTRCCIEILDPTFRYYTTINVINVAANHACPTGSSHSVCTGRVGMQTVYISQAPHLCSPVPMFPGTAVPMFSGRLPMFPGRLPMFLGTYCMLPGNYYHSRCPLVVGLFNGYVSRSLCRCPYLVSLLVGNFELFLSL